MRRQVSVFSIERERIRNGGAPSGFDPSAAARHHEVMAALGELRARLGDAPPAPAEAGHDGSVSEQLLADYKSEVDQVAHLKSELIHIEAAIERTKKELAGLQRNGAAGEHFAGVSDELDAVVKGTESATDTILEAAEEIDQNSRNLAAALNREGDRNMAYEINEHATRIFEACNFQDLTGQRITKVVNTLRYVEERVLRMIEIWGGLDAFKDLAVAPLPVASGGGMTLHGPGDNENDPDRVSQDDIDALFD